MHGLPVDAKLEPGRQLICGFISRTAPPSVGSSALAAARSTTPYDAPPAFLSELSPTARAMMAVPSDEPQPTNQIVQSDGETVWLAEPAGINGMSASHPGLHSAGLPSQKGVRPEEVFVSDRLCH